MNKRSASGDETSRGRTIIRRAALAAATVAAMATTVLVAPGTASAHVGNYCGHGSGPAHLHAPLTNTTSQFVRSMRYVHQDGSVTHYHLYRIDYYSVGVSWTDYEWKRCPRH
jgi:hypothetical protein